MSDEHAFGPGVRRILQVFCDVVFDPGRDDRTSPADIALADEVSRGMAAAPASNRLGLALLIRMLDWMPLLLIGRASRFVRLDREEQRRFLERLFDHPWRALRLAGTALRITTSLYYWQHPRVLEEIGFAEVELLPESVLDEQVAS